MRLAELQTRMRRMLLDNGADAELPAWLADPPEQRERRLAVHRNNVRHTLSSVLEAAFPVVQQLLDTEGFTAITMLFIAERPPRQPVLYDYGAAFPDFLAAFPPLAELAWLADVARLEWARNEALFAADRAPLTPAELAAVPAADLPGLRLALHPSARRLESPWPIYAIWVAHQPDSEPLDPVSLAQAETVLVWRWGGSVRQRSLTPGESALLAAFAAEYPLAEAVAAAMRQDRAFELAPALAWLLANAVLIDPH